MSDTIVKQGDTKIVGPKLSSRLDFEAVTASEVLDPTRLPTAYAWLRAGSFAVYHGVPSASLSSQPPTDWGWEIDYVNGKTRDGQLSAVGYTIYMAKGSKHIQSWLTWPTLFPGFHMLPRAGEDEVTVAGVAYRTFKEVRDREGGMGVVKHLWYESRTCLLLKLDVQIVGNGPLIYQCILGDGNVLPAAQAGAEAAQIRVTQPGASARARGAQVGAAQSLAPEPKTVGGWFRRFFR